MPGVVAGGGGGGGGGGMARVLHPLSSSSSSVLPPRRCAPRLLAMAFLLILTNIFDVAEASSRRSSRRRCSTSPTTTTTTTTTTKRIGGTADGRDDIVGDLDAYDLLARCIRRRLDDAIDARGGEGSRCHDVSSISNALRSASSTQMALKKIDGAAHELYQRTHRSSTSLDDDDEHESENENYEDGGGKGGTVAVGGLKVIGRMSRNAARVGCVADALFASELCELASLSTPSSSSSSSNTINGAVDEDGDDDDDGTLASWTGREVVMNITLPYPSHPSSFDDDDDDDIALSLSMSVLVIYERGYDGGAGVDHGGVDDLLSLSTREGGGETPSSSHPSGEGGGEVDNDDSTSTGAADAADVPAKMPSSPRGRYLVVLSEHHRGARRGMSKSTSSSGGDVVDLSSILSILDAPPVRLGRGGRVPTNVAVVDGEGSAMRTVCEPLYRMAGRVLEAIGSTVLSMTTTNATNPNGGGASNDHHWDDDEHRSRRGPAIHFVGHSLAGGVAALSACIVDGTIPHPAPTNTRGKNKRRRSVDASLSGSGCGRASALCLGAPPCLSSNICAPFIKSVIHGDDVVCRMTRASIDNLCDHTIRLIKGGLLGRSVGWVSGAVSLTVSGITGNIGRRGGGGKLVVPGKVLLVHPRRMGGGSSSIHEVGGQGGETLRAALLWQLNDVLLSKSLWSHHRLDAYIRSLDRVRLKGFVDDQSIGIN